MTDWGHKTPVLGRESYLQLLGPASILVCLQFFTLTAGNYREGAQQNCKGKPIFPQNTLVDKLWGENVQTVIALQTQISYHPPLSWNKQFRQRLFVEVKTMRREFTVEQHPCNHLKKTHLLWSNSLETASVIPEWPNKLSFDMMKLKYQILWNTAFQSTDYVSSKSIDQPSSF